MKKLSLSKPFQLRNGNEISEFHLDFDSLSVADFRQVSRLEGMISDNRTVELDEAFSKKVSFKFQLASGFIAATKGTPGLTVEDFTQLPMKESLDLAQSAYFFWLGVESEQSAI